MKCEKTSCGPSYWPNSISDAHEIWKNEVYYLHHTERIEENPSRGRGGSSLQQDHGRLIMCNKKQVLVAFCIWKLRVGGLRKATVALCKEATLTNRPATINLQTVLHNRIKTRGSFNNCNRFSHIQYPVFEHGRKYALVADFHKH